MPTPAIDEQMKQMTQPGESSDPERASHLAGARFSPQASPVEPPTPPRYVQSQPMSHAVVGARYMAPGAPTPRWTSLREWAIRPKLIVALTIPTLAALVLGGVGMLGALNQTGAYSHAVKLSSAAHQVQVLVSALQAERDVSADRVASGQSPAPTVYPQQVAVDHAADNVKATLTALDTSYDAAVKRDVAAALDAVAGMPNLRSRTALGQEAAYFIISDYASVVDALLQVNTRLWVGSTDAALVQQVAALDDMSRAGELASQQRALLSVALRAGGFGGSAISDLIAAQAKQDAAVAAFRSRATPASQQVYDRTVTGTGVVSAAAILRKAIAKGSTKDIGANAQQWFSLKSQEVDRIHQVASGQLKQIVDRVQSLRASQQRRAATAGLIILLILLFALAATAVVARSMIRPLQRLRTAAFDVADRGLPEIIRRLHEGEAQDFDENVQPVDVTARDEIGQVARAFDEVHAQAVRLAGEQALMRRNMSAMFVNLSRRSQSLVERQLRVIDELETTEQDPDHLASLFTLDLLATRMRRNDENLLVLAGAEGGRRWNTPVALLDVVRAAVAEVEQYARVRSDVEPGFEIVSGSAGGVVHLLAELLENAAAFSAPGTPVEIRARSLGASEELMIEVEDQGIGMTATQMAQANDRLAAPPVFDVSASRMMGLYVVARLAQRHEINVRLRPSPHGGVIALVQLPARLVLAVGAQALPGAAVAQAKRGHEEVETRYGRAQARNDELGSPGYAANGFVRHDAGNRDAGGDVRRESRRPDVVSAGAGATIRSATRAQDPDAESLPIFDTVQSEWFSKPPEYDVPGPMTGPAAEPAPVRRDWASPADEGWRVAQAVSSPLSSGVTAAGLPIRVRGSNLVPGTAATSTPVNAPRPPAHAARGLSSFQRGVARGRGGEPVPSPASESAGTPAVVMDPAEPQQQEARP